MREALAACWPLLLGIGLMMLGNGMQGTLLGLRANLEGFPTAITGIIMSGYYVGFLLGSVLTPRILGNVGHVRVFAALASLGSTAALIHAVFPDPTIWTIFRVVTGFSFAGLYIVSESWLNDTATNETRGQILSVYMLVTFIGIAGGQFLLTIADPGGYSPFIIVSILVSLALIPTALTASPMPAVQKTEKLGVRQLYRISPLGVVGILFVGVLQGAFFAMGAVFGGLQGLTVFQISMFMSLSVVGGALFQMPIGKISDIFDRRQVLMFCALITGALALATVYVAQNYSVYAFLAIATVYGGFCMPLYSLCIAHTNDHMEPSQMVAASSGLILVNGAGAIVGPIIVSSLMGWFGGIAFYLFMAAVSFVIVLFALYRMTRRQAVPEEDQNDFVAMPVRSGVVAVGLNPEAEWEGEEEELSSEAGEGSLTKASMAILEDLSDDDDEDELMDDGPSIWNRNG
ncbi:MFS transporter [Sneathiella sp. P13V-1]|uniref:MFS transporter n=1 Tax=Sneathiella sp. P13V-1 TaxID=2697366 RepID=UPI00187B2957|nr:MFS transporter [Sneathiella sp. P13V-1]MBE7637132.1 MFS transporter [Sneathiella sp. P13V-1]